MSAQLLDGVVGVLDVLSTSPHPDDAAAALVDHLQEPLGVRSSVIMAAQPPRLVILGLAGYPAEEVAGLDFIPLDGAYPVPRAIREGEILIEESQTMQETYADMRRPGGRWHLTLRRAPDGCTVSVPVFCSGRPVGGYALITDRQAWTTLDVSALDALGHALGIWLTHPDAGLPEVPGVAPPRLTSRQVGILSMTANGMGNAAIADALGISESTVKQEFGRILRVLDATDRRSAVARASQLGVLEGASP